MPALIQFVDSIASSPTVRLDVNNATTWFCQSFKAPPPRLRRSVSANAMRDGDHVSSSSYENRTLELELTLIADVSEEAAATQMQNLWRELDRPTNLLRYQPEGMSKPVFFRLFRSDVSDLEELWTTPIARNITLELLAEPFALGLRETLGPYTVNNNPAAATNPCYFDVTGTLGDVAAPIVMWSGASGAGYRHTIIATHGSTSALPVLVQQAEGATLAVDTTNPGGGPDAAMSGTGTNNFARVSFATNAALWPRLTLSVATPNSRGSYRLVAFVRRSDASTSTFVMRAANGPTVTVGSGTTSRMVVDLGVVTFNGSDGLVGYSSSSNAASTYLFSIAAGRLVGSGTLDIDAVVMVATEGQGAPQSSTLILEASLPVIDSARESVYGSLNGGDPTSGGNVLATTAPAAGGFPLLYPSASATNRFVVFASATNGASVVDLASPFSLAYWPRYLFVRPSAS